MSGWKQRPRPPPLPPPHRQPRNASRQPLQAKPPTEQAGEPHMTVTATAPDLSPKTWYGMPAYANADGKVVVFFQDSGKFSYRYSTLGFQDAANLDDGDLWPVSFALQKWSAVVEKKVVELVKAAVSCPVPRPPPVALPGYRGARLR